MKGIGVTGASGFLATHVVRQLLDDDETVVALTRRPLQIPADPRVLQRSPDLTRSDECADALHGCSMVVHLAASGGGFAANVNRDYALLTDNLVMSLAVLEGARRAGVRRYVYVSSSAVYGDRTGLLEEDEAGPPFLEVERGFATAKWTAEEQLRLAVRDGGMEGCVVRPTNPYGPYDALEIGSAHFIPALIMRVLATEPGAPLQMGGSGRVNRNFVHGADVARGIVAAMRHGRNGAAYNVGAPCNHSLADVTRLVLAEMGRGETDVRFNAEAPAGHPGRQPDLARAARDLAYAPALDMAEGIADTVAWYRTALSR